MPSPTPTQDLQAFRIRDRAWGLQFHPEPTEQMITGWLQSSARPMEKQGMQPEDVPHRRGETSRVWSELGAGIAQRFVQVVRGTGLTEGIVGILEGRRILVTGVLTDDSLAFGTARLAQEEGAEVALTGFGRGLSLTTRVARKLPAPVEVYELDVTVAGHAEHVARPSSREDGARSTVSSTPSASRPTAASATACSRRLAGRVRRRSRCRATR